MVISSQSIIIKINSLVKVYGRKKIFQNLDLIVNRGEASVLIGVNGSGKTTLLRILSTLTKPDSGTIYISNHSISKHFEIVLVHNDSGMSPGRHYGIGVDHSDIRIPPRQQFEAAVDQNGFKMLARKHFGTALDHSGFAISLRVHF